MSKIKVGVVGTGFIGPAHIEADRAYLPYGDGGGLGACG